MNSIGIVGLGISGLHLALYLQQRNVTTTIYSSRSIHEFASGPIPNLVTRWGPTLQREEQLGVRDQAAHLGTHLRLRIPAAEIDLVGRLAAPSETTDFRLYVPRLAQAYTDRGGRISVQPCGPPELAGLTDGHDLVVVAAGRDGFGETFPIEPEHTPLRSPSRFWTAGLYEGAGWPAEADTEMTVVPGVAEIFNIRFESRLGSRANVGFAAVPGGPLEYLSRIPRATEPDTFVAAVLGALEQFAPYIRERVDATRFQPAGPGEIVQGGFTPYVRRAWTRVGARHVMAVGDAWVLNDPILAQGANLASRAAFVLGDAIVSGGPFDEAFCRDTAAAMWAAAEAPCVLTNAFLEPPPPHVVELLARAGNDPALADRVVSGLGAPEDMLALLASTPAAA